MTLTNFLDPSTLQVENKNPNTIKEFLVGAVVLRYHAAHLIVIGNMHTDA